MKIFNFLPSLSFELIIIQRGLFAYLYKKEAPSTPGALSVKDVKMSKSIAFGSLFVL